MRRYAEEMKLEKAVDRAIDECIREGILAEFLSEHRAEAKAMSIYEYDEERHMRQTREEGYDAGRADGYDTGRSDGYHTGKEEGEEQFASLAKVLLEAGRNEDLSRAIKDIDYRKQLYEEYHL